MRKVLLTVVAAVAALFMTLGAGMTGAYFTSQAKVAENRVTAGTVAVSTEPTTAALSVASLSPGTTTQRDVTVVNTGSLPVDLTLTVAKSAGITAMWESLEVTATGPAGGLYAGPLSTMKTAPVRLEPGQRAPFTFGLGLPASIGNDLAGDYVKFSLVVDAEQTP